MLIAIHLKKIQKVQKNQIQKNQIQKSNPKIKSKKKKLEIPDYRVCGSICIAPLGGLVLHRDCRLKHIHAIPCITSLVLWWLH